jgi:hypothetical protein
MTIFFSLFQFFIVRQGACLYNGITENVPLAPIRKSRRKKLDTLLGNVNRGPIAPPGDNSPPFKQK